MKGPLSQAMPDDGRGLHLVNRCSVVLCSWEQWNRNFSHKVIVRAFQMWKQQARTWVAPTRWAPAACLLTHLHLFITMESSGRSIIYYARLSLICISIVSNAWVRPRISLVDVRCLLDPRLFAGGIFIFPLLSPALASHLKLTQPQLTTIVLAWVYRIVLPL